MKASTTGVSLDSIVPLTVVVERMYWDQCACTCSLKHVITVQWTWTRHNNNKIVPVQLHDRLTRPLIPCSCIIMMPGFFLQNCNNTNIGFYNLFWGSVRVIIQKTQTHNDCGLTRKKPGHNGRKIIGFLHKNHWPFGLTSISWMHLDGNLLIQVNNKKQWSETSQTCLKYRIIQERQLYNTCNRVRPHYIHTYMCFISQLHPSYKCIR